MKNATQKVVAFLFLGALLTWFGYQTFFAAPQKSDTANALIHPTQQEMAVTIPEGFSIAEIDERLTEMGLTNAAGEFAQKAAGLEGSLFPDTYFVSSTNFKPEHLIAKMKNNFARKLTPDLVTEANRGKRTLSQVITMASMLEKEAQKEKDLAVIAGILWKRLDADWPLQVDATLLYGKNTTTITFQILEEDTPYNTRKHKGLPPTPVGNPGLRTIRAAIFPEDSLFWFYLSDHEGNIRYAKTNEEQNANRRIFLEE